MRVEAGKFYRANDGSKVGPMDIGTAVAWASIDGRQAGYFLDGRAATSHAPSDLIEEWTDTPRPDDASAYHSSGLPVCVSRDDAVRLAADLMHDPAAVALRAELLERAYGGERK